MNKYLDTFIERFSQESTWRGLVAILTGLGVVMDPARSESIIALGLFIIGTINVAKNK